MELFLGVTWFVVACTAGGIWFYKKTMSDERDAEKK